jgi:hypothetical protein
VHVALSRSRHYLHLSDFAKLAFSERYDFEATHLHGAEDLHVKRTKFLKLFCRNETAYTGNYIVKGMRRASQNFFLSERLQSLFDFLLGLKNGRLEFSPVNKLRSF